MDSKEGRKEVLANRRNWYWDSAFRVAPYVRYIPCDRRYPVKQDCQQLIDAIGNLTGLDVVIDFSAYYPESVTEFLQVLRYLFYILL